MSPLATCSSQPSTRWPEVGTKCPARRNHSPGPQGQRCWGHAPIPASFQMSPPGGPFLSPSSALPDLWLLFIWARDFFVP